MQEARDIGRGRGRGVRGVLMGTTALVLAGMAAPALAQGTAQPAGETEGFALDPLVITTQAESARGPVTGYVARRTTTGSKVDIPIEEVPQTISVIGREQLDDQQVRKADEALRYVAGVRAQPFGPDHDTDWFYIRGFDAGQTGVFLDNLPLYQYGFGAFVIDPFLLERIEVLKGPSSALYGGASPGGLVNYVGKRPTGERLRYAETGIDNWGTGFVSFDLGDRLDPEGGLSFRLTGRLAGGETEIDYSDGWRGFIAPSLAWRPDDRTSLTLHGSYQRMDVEHTSGFLPYVGTVVDAPFGKIEPGFFYSEPDIDKVEREQAMVGYEFEHDFSDALTFRQNARYARVDTEEAGPYPYGYVDEATGLLNRIGFEHDTTVNTVSLDNQVESRFRTGALDHTLLAGIDYRYYNIDHVQAAGAATPISVVDPVYGLPQPAVAPYLDQDLTLQQLGFYAQDQIKFGDGWIVTLNGRYDRLWTDSSDEVGSANFKRTDGEFSGRVGLGYEFANGLTPYVSYARSFNPTIGADSSGRPFTPETGEQYEAGVKYTPGFADASITASVFEITRKNVPVSDPNNLFFEVQRGEVRSRGIEVEGHANLTDNLKLLAAISVMDIEVTEDTNPALIGRRPTLMPELQAAAWLDYSFPAGALEGFSIGGGVRYVGETYADEMNQLEVPSHTVFDAALRYERDGWGVSLNVINLFDKEYVAGCDGEFVCNYGEQRTAMLRLSRTW